MKQTDLLSAEAQRLIDQFLSEHDFQLIGIETSEPDFDETPGGSCADDVTYSTKEFTRTTFLATGFTWHHPHGGVISGMFNKPIEALVRLIDKDGQSDRTFHDDKVCAAIVAKCGRISGFAESAWFKGR